MSLRYRFAGIELTSNVAVAGLRGDDGINRSVAGGLTLEAVAEPPPTPDRIVFAWPGRYATRLGIIGDDWLIDSRFDGVFRVDRAITNVKIYSSVTPPSAACIDVLVRRILPRLMAARGAVTIHAAAASTGGVGALLLGASGAGKSTTTAALATMPQWDVFSDDLSMLWDDAPPVVAPGATGVCLWETSRTGLGLDPALCHPMPGYDGKYRFEPQRPTPTAAVPLRALVFLSREPELDAPVLTTINRAEALIHAVRHTVLFNPAAPPGDEQAATIARLNRITTDAQMVRLSYPSRFDALSGVADALARLIDP